MGLKPAKLFVESGGYIVREYASTDNVLVEKGELLIIAYNSSDFTLHSKLIKPTIAFIPVRVPTADGWDASYYNAIMDENLSVGSPFVYDNTGLAYSTYTGKDGFHPASSGVYYYDGSNPIRSSGEYVFFYVTKHAYNTKGNIGSPTEDQTFSFSDFDLTYTQGAVYSFTVESSFNGGYRDYDEPNIFSLSAVYHADAIPQYAIESGVFYYKKTEESTYQSIPFTGNSLTVPSGTFDENSTYDVYFTAESTEGDSTRTPTVELTTIDGQAVTTPVSPNNEVTHGDVNFAWNYSNTSGASQYAFDIQISQDNETWETVLSHVVTSKTSYVYTQILAGTTYWRVRGYNQDDVAGDWSSSLSYLNSVPPQPPVISEIIPGGRIQVRWSADGQISYRIEVLNDATGATVYDSGDVYGTESLALVNTYLPNGNYVVRVKISNIYGKESAWSSTIYRQTTELPGLQYSAGYTEGGVNITVSSSGFDTYYLIRNGELIANFNTNSYTDVFASGKTNYRLIAVDSNDNFAQAVFTIDAAVPSARLITPDGLVLTVSERWDNFNNAGQSEEIRYSANEYLGASTPEHLFSRMRVKRFTRAFYDPNRIAKHLLGTVAFYADEYGNGDWVAITSYTRADSWLGDDTNIEMEVTTRKEDVTYAV